MKNFILSFGILLISTASFGQWTNYNVFDTISADDVFFIDPMNGWMVGSRETLYEYSLVICHTNDGGNSLEVQYENPLINSSHSKIFFVNNSHGWAVCNDSIVHTIDGGITWLVQGPGIYNYPEGLDLFFIDEQKGWIAGGNTVLRTINGGITWDTVSFASNSINRIQFTDSLNGWAAGENKIHLTNDGGNTWNEIVISNNFFITDMYFVSANVGWIIGRENNNLHILKTTDEGATWVEQYNENVAGGTRICFTDSLHGWATTIFTNLIGNVLYTEDGGAIWILREDVVTCYSMSSISFGDPQHGYMVGNGIFMRTQNAGQTWALKGFSNKRISNISFGDTDHGAAIFTYHFGTMVGNLYFNFLLTTKDGGLNWSITGSQPIDQMSYSYFRSVFMHDSTHITLNSDYFLLQSQDGGLSWDTTYGLPTPNLFINPDTGWCISYNPQGTWIGRTYNGGLTWDVFQMSTTSYNISSVFFFPSSENSEFGCAVGSGNIFTTSDRGETWSHTSWGSNAELKDVFFADENNGWIVGNYPWNGGALILHTADGGLNWDAQVYANAGNSFSSVWFFNSETGYALGDDAMIHQTSDGGVNWEPQASPLTESWYYSKFSYQKNKALWISGEGALLKYDISSILAIPESNSETLSPQCEIFPNPFRERITIRKNEASQGIEKIEVYNSIGSLVNVFSSEKTSEVLSLNLGHLQPGVYLLKITTGGKISTEKIIKVDGD